MLTVIPGGLNKVRNFMDYEKIKAHWRDWAIAHGKDLRATTKTSTVKDVEVDALCRAFRRVRDDINQELTVLEVGSGNGQNCLRLAHEFPHFQFTGFDYVEEMVAAANSLKLEQGLSDSRIRFYQDDIVNPVSLNASYDIIFTDRCLINLNTTKHQLDAISLLFGHLNPYGHLVMIENSQQTYANQNRARELLGLPPRTPAEFNLFFDDEVILKHLSDLGFNILDIDDFVSLHDFFLYVLVPLLNDNQILYDDPLVDVAASVSIAISSEMPGAFGQFGQNRLYHCHKRKA